MNTGFFTLIFLLNAMSCLSFVPVRLPLSHPSATSTPEITSTPGITPALPRSDSAVKTTTVPTLSISPSTTGLPNSTPLSTSPVTSPFPITSAFPILYALPYRSTSTSSSTLSDEEVEKVKNMYRRYCGPGIPNVLRVVCGGRYRRDLTAMGVRPTTGIVAECCRAECNLEVLTSYCAPGVTPDIITFAKYHEGISKGIIRFADFVEFR